MSVVTEPTRRRVRPWAIFLTDRSELGAALRCVSTTGLHATLRADRVRRFATEGAALHWWTNRVPGDHRLERRFRPFVSLIEPAPVRNGGAK